MTTSEATKPPRPPIYGLPLAAIIVGGAAFLFGLVPGFGLLLAIAGLVLATIAIVTKRQPAWMPIVGGVASGIALLTGIVVLAVAASIGRLSTMPTSNPIETAPVETSGPAETVAPVEETPTPSTPAQPEMTMGQRQALGAAEDYLRFTSFSRTGLIEQLEYEGFSAADAAFAVDALDIDWNEQAAITAADYLEMTSFSRQGLIDQLVYEGFTQAEAEYGVTAVGY